MIKLGRATLSDLTAADHESFQIWEKLAKREKYSSEYSNFFNPIPLNLLGSCYEIGRYTAQDKERAEKIYNIAANLDKKYNLPLLRMKEDKLNRRHP